MPLNYAIVGEGRMGRAIASIADARGHRRVASSNDADGLDRVLDSRPDIAFEFTRPDAAPSNVRRLLGGGIGVVCGTTGWQPDVGIRQALDAGGAALVIEPNFSLGVQLYLRLVGQAAGLAARLDSHDPAITEWHHRGKLDAPSGTALRMASIVRAAGAAREAGAMQIAAVRVGHEPGRHQLTLDGAHDRIVIEHAARGRDGFALGAVQVAEWIEGKSGMLSLERLIDEQLESGARRPDGGQS